MHFALLDDELDEQLSIPLRGEMLEAICIQWARCDTPELLSGWASKLRAALEPAIATTLDWDLRPPSKAQVEYALAIAKALKINLPGEALQFQGMMRDFLDRNADHHKAKCLKRPEQS